LAIEATQWLQTRIRQASHRPALTWYTDQRTDCLAGPRSMSGAQPVLPAVLRVQVEHRSCSSLQAACSLSVYQSKYLRPCGLTGLSRRWPLRGPNANDQHTRSSPPKRPTGGSSALAWPQMTVTRSPALCRLRLDHQRIHGRILSFSIPRP